MYTKQALKTVLTRTLMILDVMVILILAFLVYDYQVFWTISTYYILIVLLVPPTSGCLIVFYLLVKKKKPLITYLILVISLVILSFSILALSRFGPISIFSPQDNSPSDERIIERILSDQCFDWAAQTDNKLAVHPINYYPDGKDELKKEFSQYSSLIDQFYEKNNPCKLVLESSPYDFCFFVNSNEPAGGFDTGIIDFGVSSPAYDPKSGYLIEYTGGSYAGRLELFRYKLGKLLYIETLDEWWY
jgi:hypothetical protein